MIVAIGLSVTGTLVVVTALLVVVLAQVRRINRRLDQPLSAAAPVLELGFEPEPEISATEPLGEPAPPATDPAVRASEVPTGRHSTDTLPAMAQVGPAVSIFPVTVVRTDTECLEPSDPTSPVWGPGEPPHDVIRTDWTPKEPPRRVIRADKLTARLRREQGRAR